eukprot:CAMPEP_0183346006 /NCGR_PEP_ID=MMETSP0164_2-20130417/11250_1 /TAXON_ID=221442 /ORGANISM="Coccolithus pelagicus ssp braarudi, Strain PLY182g" /LENGTH=54 /DNA_ID=CAMNT_0025517217 /DNA_START=332 /DNA_END=496 /DNA_ORIENTATION=+
MTRFVVALGVVGAGVYAASPQCKSWFEDNMTPAQVESDRLVRRFSKQGAAEASK